MHPYIKKDKNGINKLFMPFISTEYVFYNAFQKAAILARPFQ
jgi:hypothetical protein